MVENIKDTNDEEVNLSKLVDLLIFSGNFLEISKDEFCSPSSSVIPSSVENWKIWDAHQFPSIFRTKTTITTM
jgi:hypothetical protein